MAGDEERRDMGKIIRLACRSCGHEREYRVGAGLLHDPLTPVGVTSGIPSKQVQDEILLLLEGEDVSARAGYLLYHCQHCCRFHAQLAVEVQHHRGVYRNRCRCPRCNRGLAPWDGRITECSCPRCGRTTLGMETTGDWS